MAGGGARAAGQLVAAEAEGVLGRPTMGEAVAPEDGALLPLAAGGVPGLDMRLLHKGDQLGLPGDPGKKTKATLYSHVSFIIVFLYTAHL